ncbi:hypothetical protein HRbin17_02133 [bacterium HR17]|uniref:Uncharacterized protein n=1 Tax=Candidatus Fervidibacter japonicus TaxID=2035412 RepID=A0A2H5XEK6_9BACT|nr:hypothetical protein HRbin17_02133 [bacterium HR17]
MGILRLYVTLLRCLAAQPDNAIQKSLDEIAGGYGDFAYIGSRRTLQSIVLKQAGLLHQRLQNFDKRFYDEVAQKQPALFKRLAVCRDDSDSRKVAAAWYGRGDWAKDSGVFPDFVLALDDLETFGNGAILELKDSNGSNIASFNSTSPLVSKALEKCKQSQEVKWLWKQHGCETFHNHSLKIAQAKNDIASTLFAPIVAYRNR